MHRAHFLGVWPVLSHGACVQKDLSFVACFAAAIMKFLKRFEQSLIFSFCAGPPKLCLDCACTLHTHYNFANHSMCRNPMRLFKDSSASWKAMNVSVCIFAGVCVCMSVCGWQVIRCHWVAGRERGQRAEEEAAGTASISTRSVIATPSPPREEARCWAHSPGTNRVLKNQPPPDPHK